MPRASFLAPALMLASVGLSLTLLLPGCHDDAPRSMTRLDEGSANHTPANNAQNNIDFDPVVANNAANNANSDAPNNTMPLLAVDFELVNGRALPLWIQTSDLAGNPTWVNILDTDGRVLRLHATCGICACGVEDCSICEAATPEVMELGPGQTARWRWEGQVRRLVEQGERACEVVEPAMSDAHFATFVWSETTVDRNGGQELIEPSTADVPFELGTDRVVRHTIEPPPIPTEPVTFRLMHEDSTTGPIYAQASNDDWVLGWLSLFGESGAFRHMPGWCECACEELPCMMQCEVSAPFTLPVAPGESIEYAWDSVRYDQLRPAAEACYERRSPPSELRAVFCWGEDTVLADSGEYVLDPLCHTIPLSSAVGQTLTHLARSPDTELELRNTTDAPIYVQLNDEIGQPAWYRLAQEGRRFLTQENCGLCECHIASCGVCGSALPHAQRLLPGESIRARWRGQAWRVEGALGCEYPEVITAGSVTAELCWGTGFNGEEHDGALIGAVTDVYCASVTADVGVPAVRVDAE